MARLKQISIIILLLAVFAVVVFFLVREKNDQYADLGPEVLLGSECGFDYLPCCETEPKCSFGQKCCPDPNDPGRTYCADECTCGAENEFCCAGDTCAAGLFCHSGNCLYCGREGDLCCPGDNSCDSGSACLEGRCVLCGVLGNPCCEPERACLAATGTRAECFDGLCGACGQGGARACQKGEACLSGHLHNNSVCYPCGGANQPCCDPGAGLAYDCDSSKGLTCQLGFCQVK